MINLGFLGWITDKSIKHDCIICNCITGLYLMHALLRLLNTCIPLPSHSSGVSLSAVITEDYTIDVALLYRLLVPPLKSRDCSESLCLLLSTTYISKSSTPASCESTNGIEMSGNTELEHLKGLVSQVSLVPRSIVH